MAKYAEKHNLINFRTRENAVFLGQQSLVKVRNFLWFNLRTKSLSTWISYVVSFCLILSLLVSLSIPPSSLPRHWPCFSAWDGSVSIFFSAKMSILSEISTYIRDTRVLKYTSILLGYLFKKIILFLAVLYLLCWTLDFSSCNAWAPHCGGFSYCGAQALECWLSSCGTQDQWFHSMWSLPPGPRNQTRTPNIGRWTPNHWTTREVHPRTS